MAQYTPKTWTTGETITAAELNAIEQAAAAALPATDAAATYVAQANAIDLETTQDSVAGMFTGGTHSGISFAYDDPNGHINATVAVAGLPATIVSKTTAYTAAAGNFVQADATTAGFTVTLPTAPAVGALVAVKKVDTSANVVTVAPAASGTIDGDPNATIIAKGAGAVFEHVGSNAWQVTAVTSAAGPAGPAGPAGTNGTNGSNGAAATIAVGTVTTGAAGSAAAVTNAGTSSAAVFNFTIPQGAAGAGGGTGALTPTATKTAAYTVAVGELAMMNVAGGATTLTLPAAPADKAQLGYRAIGATSGTPLTINRGGSDTIGTAGATSASIPLADETVVLQYDAPNTRWLGIANVRTQASVDARYDAAGAAAAVLPTQTGNSGKFLTTNGTAASWGTPAGGGGTSGPTVRPLLPTGSLTGAFAETLPRFSSNVAAGTIATGIPKLAGITLNAGEVVSKLIFMNGGTALATGTHAWAGLTDTTGVVLAVTADDTAPTWAANTAKTFTLTSSYTVPTTGMYYVALCLSATTMPGPMTVTASGGLPNMLPVISAVAASQPAPPTVGASLTSLVSQGNLTYAAVA